MKACRLIAVVALLGTILFFSACTDFPVVEGITGTWVSVDGGGTVTFNDDGTAYDDTDNTYLYSIDNEMLTLTNQNYPDSSSTDKYEIKDRMLIVIHSGMENVFAKVGPDSSSLDIIGNWTDETHNTKITFNKEGTAQDNYRNTYYFAIINRTLILSDRTRGHIENEKFELSNGRLIFTFNGVPSVFNKTGSGLSAILWIIALIVFVGAGVLMAVLLVKKKKTAAPSTYSNNDTPTDLIQNLHPQQQVESIEKRLVILNDLKNKGAISSEEYEIKRKNILGIQ